MYTYNFLFYPLVALAQGLAGLIIEPALAMIVNFLLYDRALIKSSSLRKFWIYQP